MAVFLHRDPPGDPEEDLGSIRWCQAQDPLNKQAEKEQMCVRPHLIISTPSNTKAVYHTKGGILLNMRG